MIFYKENNFKETPIGKAPNDWKIVGLGEVSEVRPGKSKDSINAKEAAFIPMELIPEDSIYTSFEMKELSKVSSCTYCETGDLLLAKITPSLENGKQVIVPETVPDGFALATTEVFPIICKNIDKMFLFHLLKFQKYRRVLENSMRATTGRLRVPKDALLDMKVSLPQSLEEQRKIGQVLSTVDEAIQKSDEIVAKTERLKKGLMQELLTKGIGHREFKDTEIGRIPKNWEVARLGDMGEFQYGVTASAIKENTGVKLLRITDITNQGIEWEAVPYCNVTESEVSKYRLKIGDILFARIGATTGKTCYIDRSIKGVFGSYLIKFRPTVKLVTSFLHFYTQSGTYWSQVNRRKEGQLKKGLNIVTLGSLLFPFPTAMEQQKIAKILLTVDKKLELERNEKTRLERIKQGLMDLLLTGRVRVKVIA